MILFWIKFLSRVYELQHIFKLVKKTFIIMLLISSLKYQSIGRPVSIPPYFTGVISRYILRMRMFYYTCAQCFLLGLLPILPLFQAQTRWFFRTLTAHAHVLLHMGTMCSAWFTQFSCLFQTQKRWFFRALMKSSSW